MQTRSAAFDIALHEQSQWKDVSPSALSPFQPALFSQRLSRLTFETWSPQLALCSPAPTLPETKSLNFWDLVSTQLHARWTLSLARRLDLVCGQRQRWTLSRARRLDLGAARLFGLGRCQPFFDSTFRLPPCCCLCFVPACVPGHSLQRARPGLELRPATTGAPLRLQLTSTTQVQGLGTSLAAPRRSRHSPTSCGSGVVLPIHCTFRVFPSYYSFLILPPQSPSGWYKGDTPTALPSGVL